MNIDLNLNRVHSFIVLQMMFGVNMFSMMLCFVTLIEEGTFLSPFRFLATHEGFCRDIILLSLSGALGQVYLNSFFERK